MLKNLFLFCFALHLSTIVTITKADALPKFSFSGFGSLGGIGTDTSTVSFYRDGTQLKPATSSWNITTDSRLGLQMDIAFNEQFHITTQYIIRDHAGDFFEQNLEWLFLRWSPRNDLDIRIGRLGIDAFLLSDVRDVSYTYLWMRPPHEFYNNIVGGHFDGIDISQHYKMGNNYLKLKLFAGYAHGNLRQSPNTIEAPIAGISISSSRDNWYTRIGYTYLQILNEALANDIVQYLNDPNLDIIFPGFSQIAPQFSSINNYGHYISLGSTYDDGVWQIQAEAAYAHTNARYYPSLASAYLSIGRRFDALTVYALYGVSHSFQKKVDIPPPVIALPIFQEAWNNLDKLANQNGQNEQSLSLGLRWDFYTNVAFKVQWSHYWMGTAQGARSWAPPYYPSNVPYNINVWSVGLDFIF